MANHYPTDCAFLSLPLLANLLSHQLARLSPFFVWLLAKAKPFLSSIGTAHSCRRFFILFSIVLAVALIEQILGIFDVTRMTKQKWPFHLWRASSSQKCRGFVLAQNNFFERQTVSWKFFGS